MSAEIERLRSTHLRLLSQAVELGDRRRALVDCRPALRRQLRRSSAIADLVVVAMTCVAALSLAWVALACVIALLSWVVL